jgi:hypothetical protein
MEAEGSIHTVHFRHIKLVLFSKIDWISKKVVALLPKATKQRLFQRSPTWALPSPVAATSVITSEACPTHFWHTGLL